MEALRAAYYIVVMATMLCALAVFTYGVRRGLKILDDCPKRINAGRSDSGETLGSEVERRGR